MGLVAGKSIFYFWKNDYVQRWKIEVWITPSEFVIDSNIKHEKEIVIFHGIATKQCGQIFNFEKKKSTEKPRSYQKQKDCIDSFL